MLCCDGVFESTLTKVVEEGDQRALLSPRIASNMRRSGMRLANSSHSSTWDSVRIVDTPKQFQARNFSLILQVKSGCWSSHTSKTERNNQSRGGKKTRDNILHSPSIQAATKDKCREEIKMLQPKKI